MIEEIMMMIPDRDRTILIPEKVNLRIYRGPVEYETRDY